MQFGRLQDRVAIVTGAASGIGCAAARLFAAEGASVVLADRDVSRGQVVAEGIAQAGHHCTFLHVDVTEPCQIRALVDEAVGQFGKLDVAYSNAGVSFSGNVDETGIEDFQRVISVNLASHFALAKYATVAMRKNGGGSIIFTASEMGLVGASGQVAYCAAKAGVLNLARALAVDCAEAGIRVNSVVPGPIATPMLKEWLEASENPIALEAAQLRPVLLRRFGTPEEIARGALFLASEESSFMTGAHLVLDGGATCWNGV